MKIVQVNTFPNKSTGNIMMNIHKALNGEGHDSYVCWGRGRNAESDHEIVIKDDLGVRLHGVYTRMSDRTGFASNHATKKLLNHLDEIGPEIIHIHNLHGYYINIEMLFKYIKQHNIKVVWTLHDCWAFTGHCAYFSMCACEKWKTGCYDCEQIDTYPASWKVDSSRWNWSKKKNIFNGMDATIVVPSRWLKRQVEMSFLKNYPMKVVYNGLDLNVYKPASQNDIDEIMIKYRFNDKPIILGVASEWTERKGLADFIELSKRHSALQFVVVGLNSRQVKGLPMSLNGIRRTDKIEELVALYSAADLFFNPTYEEVFGMVNAEALACGTPVLTYDTGGSPEIMRGENDKGAVSIIKKESSHSVDVNKVGKEIEKIVKDNRRKDCDHIKAECVKMASLFSIGNMTDGYLELYQQITSK